MKRITVIGYPIAHSRSPLIHGYWLRKHNIPGLYEKSEVTPQDLQSFVIKLRLGNPSGTNVTLPHKEAILHLIDQPDERALRIGAVNTIWNDKGRLIGTSSDGPGFVASLHQLYPNFHIPGKNIAVLGAGGSARAIVDEMIRQGAAEVAIHNRTQDRATELARLFGPMARAVTKADLPATFQKTHLLINTTSAGLKGEAALEIPWQDLSKTCLVADIVYTPLITAFLREAQAKGHTILPGLGMLLHQAVVGFEKWFGIRPEVTQELHDLVARDIDPEYKQ